MEDKRGILLESGTNELEVLEFKIGQENYGINVMKVRMVMNRQRVTTIPESHPAMDGLVKIRDEVMTQVNLVKYLGKEESEEDKIIITEFNIQKLAFRVSDVSKIERISWKDIAPIKGLQTDVPVIGIVKYPDRLVLILDFENIVATIFPSETVMDYENLGRMANARIAIADDSNFILNMVNDFLSQGGYEHIKRFHNGQEALDFLEINPRSVDVLITDIEMPQMDGLTLCKRVKENKETSHIIVMLYSSLITEDLRHKGLSVGADFQVNKPQFRSILEKLSEMGR